MKIVEKYLNIPQFILHAEVIARQVDLVKNRFNKSELNYQRTILNENNFITFCCIIIIYIISNKPKYMKYINSF